MTDGRTGHVTGHGGDEGHGTIPCPFFSLEGQRRERTHSPTPNLRPFGGVLYAISEGGQSGPSFLLLAFIFQRGALAEHAVDCSVLREQRREEEKPAMRESFVCLHVAVFFQKGSKIS